MEKNHPLPSKSRQEWRDLLNGNLNVPLKNYFFQMKVTQARNQIKTGKFSLEEEVDNIYALCKKFIKAKNMDTDLAKIFGANEEEKNSEKETEKRPVVEFEHDDQQYVIEEAKEHEEAERKILEAERKKREMIERIKFQEEKAKLQSEKNKFDAEKIRLEAEKAIQVRLAVEKQKRESKNNDTDLQNKRELLTKEKRQKELQRLSAVKKKKAKVVKKKSLFGSFFGGFFRN